MGDSGNLAGGPKDLFLGTIPSYSFDPSDAWTAIFQEGLKGAALDGRYIYEVGVGSGANVIFMLQECHARHVSGSDLDPRLADLAKNLVCSTIPGLSDRFCPISGSVNLVDTEDAKAHVASSDVVVACLPQVPDPDDEEYAAFYMSQLPIPEVRPQRAADHIAHYYPWSSFQRYPFNSVGLGLNEALLRRVKALAPFGEVILNSSCRMGRENLLNMFRANGYHPEILSSKIVRQHIGTAISFYVALEATLRNTEFEEKFECEFYVDPDGTMRISATEAEDLVNADPSFELYHEVCVVRGIHIAK